MDEMEMINADYDGISDSDILVILIMDEEKSILKTRLQKLSLLYHELYDSDENITGYHAYFFGGYSDDIDESAINLTDMGILEEGRDGYSLTEYGRKLRRYILDEYEDVTQIGRVDNIKKAVESIPDKNLVGLTYHFYGESARNSTIIQSVERLNSKSRYDGIQLNDYSKSEFENKLRHGYGIRMGD